MTSHDLSCFSAFRSSSSRRLRRWWWRLRKLIFSFPISIFEITRTRGDAAAAAADAAAAAAAGGELICTST